MHYVALVDDVHPRGTLIVMYSEKTETPTLRDKHLTEYKAKPRCNSAKYEYDTPYRGIQVLTSILIRCQSLPKSPETVCQCGQPAL